MMHGHMNLKFVKNHVSNNIYSNIMFQSTSELLSAILDKIVHEFLIIFLRVAWHPNLIAFIL